jgi:alkyl hydroperoxide reductase subunit AhpC
MARRRWELDRARRDRLADLLPEQAANEIVRRIVVIDREAVVRECVMWSWDSIRECRRKLRQVLAAPATPHD